MTSARGCNARHFDPHVDLVHFAVEIGRRESEHVLAVQLVGHARERRTEVGGVLELEIAAAGLFGEPSQSAVRAYGARPSTKPWRPISNTMNSSLRRAPAPRHANLLLYMSSPSVKIRTTRRPCSRERAVMLASIASQRCVGLPC